MSSDYLYNTPQFDSNLTDVTLSDREFYDTSEEIEKHPDQFKNPDEDNENKENVDQISDSDERSVLKEVVVSSNIQNTLVSKKRKAENSVCQGNKVMKCQSLAEALYHFQKDTPPRFRGASKKNTAPETQLISQQHLRHHADRCLTQEERELKEIEEAKENFKPQQLNKKIFDPPKQVDREKNVTIPKPFNFSKLRPKKVEPEYKMLAFKANPLSQNIYNIEGLQQVTKNRLSVLVDKNEIEEDWKKDKMVNGYKEAGVFSSTQVEPFSFDERDKLRATRKIERINMKTDDVHTEFKARPATVLYKKPFQVKKSDKSTTKCLAVKLNTESRAQQRLALDQYNKACQQEK